MEINRDFRLLLHQRRADEGARFEHLPAGDFRLSIQFPEGWLPNRSATPALEDADYWEVVLYAADGTEATPSTHPRVFRDELWRRYWIRGPRAARVPTEVVQTFFDYLVLGPERYEEAILMT